MIEEVLNQKIECLRQELNDSIQSRENLVQLCDKSRQLDRLLEQYLELEQAEKNAGVTPM